MSKIDETKKEIERIYLYEHTVLPKYFEVIEQLRPYAEPGELITLLSDLYRDAGCELRIKFTGHIVNNLPEVDYASVVFTGWHGEEEEHARMESDGNLDLLYALKGLFQQIKEQK